MANLPLYQRLFGLRDNPFNPTQLPTGGATKSPMAMLATGPLLLHHDPLLEQLYSPKAGPFEKIDQDFLTLLELDNYTIDPPAAGKQSHIVMIMGSDGTGKTTLASSLIRWVTSCTPSSGGGWYVEMAWPLQYYASSAAQRDALKNARAQIDDRSPEYLCLFADNFLADVEYDLLNMFDELVANRVVFLFMIPHPAYTDYHILDENHLIHPYNTRELSPDEAALFVNDRITSYRVTTPSIASYPLFPFDETNLRESVIAGDITAGTTSGKITIRQLNKILNNVMRERAKGLLSTNKTFDISVAPATEIDRHVIDLTHALRELEGMVA